MGTGILSNNALKQMIKMITDVPGDFAEIGVFRGATFKRLLLFAQIMHRHAHAFDSFIGMNQPGEKDGKHYDTGKFNIGGVETFKKWMLAEHFDENLFSLWDGYVPSCLKKCPSTNFSFIYIDLDHHDPTAQAIEWAWPRLAKGGIMGFDDYFPGKNILASPPIDQFLGANKDTYETVYFDNSQIFIRKL